MAEFTDLELRIFTASPEEETDFTYEENYYTAISTLNSLIRSKSLDQDLINLDMSQNATQAVEPTQVKLPKIHIPSFSGEYSEWQSFFDMYTTTIHESPNLSAVQKFQYLKGLLRGEAAVLLRHITVTEGNYIGALTKLKKRYDRKKFIINTFIRTFVEQPSISHSIANNLKRLLDTSDEVIRGLHTLGDVAEIRDPWLIYLLVQKLDEKSKTHWAEHSADMDNPDFSEFLKCLSRRIDTLESVSTTSKRVMPRREIRNNVASCETERIECNAATKSVIKYECAMCQSKEHSLFHCNDFNTLDIEGRKGFIKKNNRCLNCLGSNHPVFKCLSKRRCQKCGKKHNTLLHQEEKSTDTSSHTPSNSSSDVTPLHSNNSQYMSILPTAIVNAVDSLGRMIPCRALLDSGSQFSFITQSCAKRLQLKRQNTRVSISGLGQTGCGVSKGLVTINIRTELFPEFSIEALVLPKITSPLPPHNLNINPKLFAEIKLADRQFNQRSNIDLLIGADHFFSLMKSGQIKGNANEPVLQETLFGWIVSGQSNPPKHHQLVSLSTQPTIEKVIVDIDQSLRRFWELESVNDERKILSPEETFCEKHFSNNLQRNSEGRFIVRLPFKKSPVQLGNSLNSAIQRLRGMERRFIRDPPFTKLYHEFMTEYQELNHMIEIPPPKPSENDFYLPHHGVIKTSSTTSKMRVVFDGSAKSSSEQKVTFSADVEKMYRQVDVSLNHTTFQKIVYRADSSQPIRHFRLLTVTYGLASASFLATRAIKQISEDIRDSSPHAADIIANDIYVDDLMTGADDEERAMKQIEDVTEIFRQYGFHLRKWKCNSEKVLNKINGNHHQENNKNIQDHTAKYAESVKVLGINWNPPNDCFMFTSQLPDSMNFTKRTVLSEASRLFDPLGWLAPVVITFKIFLQMLWGNNLGWDDPLPNDKHIIWERIRNNLKSIKNISIPRYIKAAENSAIDIHGFCDASQSAYGAVVFFRSKSPDGRIMIDLISAKTKVAPIKQQTLPRLELCAAVLLTSLIKSIKKEFRLHINETYAWTDSQIVLDWLASHPRRWSTFVGNRTSEVISSISREHWGHVPTAENLADCASRGLSPSELESHTLWWNGPSWLYQSAESRPPQSNIYGHEEEMSNKTFTFTLIQSNSNEWFDEMFERFSSFIKLQRVMCYVLRFVGNASNSKNSRINGIYLRREELFYVARIVCKYEQSKFYRDELAALQSKEAISKGSNLRSLDPFLDDFGILRVGGRLHNSLAPYSTKHPIIINPRSRIATLILRDVHLNNKHAGPTLLLSITRQEYWIPNGKTKAKEVIRNCVTCTKFRAHYQNQLIGSLPRSRVEFIRPYICLFICLSTKAVHLELVGDLSSDAFLASLKRFTARRGVCLELFSDNGTNFVGADHKLREDFNKIIKGSNNLSSFFSRNRIRWSFIPPSSPHFGGLWEAAIKSTKFHTKRVIGKNILTLEEMNTLLTEIEGILNSRPLCVINDTEVDPLTPSHFLIGHPLTKIPEVDITHLKVSHLSRWQMVQQISQHFWKRWYIEYLTSLQQRSKWRARQSTIQINDIVLVKDNNLPVNQWLLGKITKLHPGSDGLTRVVTLKTHNNEIKRPIHKLCLLPVSREYSAEE